MQVFRFCSLSIKLCLILAPSLSLSSVLSEETVTQLQRHEINQLESEKEQLIDKVTLTSTPNSKPLIPIPQP